jgi:hypothetical protein
MPSRRRCATAGSRHVVSTAFTVEDAYAAWRPAAMTARISATAQLILVDLRRFLPPAVRIPAPGAARLRNHGSARLDPHQQERLELYSRYIAEHGPRIHAAFPALAADPAVWDSIDLLFMAMIVDRYDADIAFSFAHSMRRNIATACGGRSPTPFRRPASCAPSRWPRCTAGCVCTGRIDVELLCTRPADAQFLGAVPGSAGRRGKNSGAGRGSCCTIGPMRLR